MIDIGVGLPSDEEFIRSEEGRRRASRLGKKGKDELISMLTHLKLDDARKCLARTKKKKNKLRKRLEEELSVRKYSNFISKVKKHCYGVRKALQSKHQKRAKWLASKYRRDDKEKWPNISNHLKQKYEDCNILKEDCTLEAQTINGAVIVNMTGENITLSDSELKLLKGGPSIAC